MHDLPIRYCVLIPVYNHSEPLLKIVPQLLNGGLFVLLVDDASSAEHASVLKNMAENDSVHYLSHAYNQGKGAALKTGMRAVSALGFSHAVQIDADGQHNLNDVAKLIDSSRSNPTAMIVAIPEYDESVPALRYYARYLTHVWVWINTISLQIKDSMCGFRVYPLRSILDIIGTEFTGDRMDFDTEILVRWVWRGLPVKQLSTKVTYPCDGVSHFRLVGDNIAISRMHARLFFGMLKRLPNLLSQRLRAIRIVSSGGR